MVTSLQLISPVMAAEAASEHAGGLSALGIDFKGLVLQVITFVLVFLILKKFAFDKILKALEERRVAIDKGVYLGQEMEAEKTKLEERIDKALKDARIEADKVLNEARADAAAVLKQAEADAAHKTETMIAQAHSKIDDDINQARQALEGELLDLVSEATEAIIDERLDVKKDQALIKKALSEVKA